jgi:hypothetical protein
MQIPAIPGYIYISRPLYSVCIQNSALHKTPDAIFTRLPYVTRESRRKLSHRSKALNFLYHCSYLWMTGSVFADFDRVVEPRSDWRGGTFFGRAYHFLAALLVFSALKLWGKKYFKGAAVNWNGRVTGMIHFARPANKLRNFNKDQFVMIDGRSNYSNLGHEVCAKSIKSQSEIASTRIYIVCSTCSARKKAETVFYSSAGQRRYAACSSEMWSGLHTLRCLLTL